MNQMDAAAAAGIELDGGPVEAVGSSTELKARLLEALTGDEPDGPQELLFEADRFDHKIFDAFTPLSREEVSMHLVTQWWEQMARGLHWSSRMPGGVYCATNKKNIGPVCSSVPPLC
jgi:hypothetical protein